MKVRFHISVSAVAALALGLAGCATPITSLKNPTTGQVVQCGGGVAGSIAGGLVGYSIEKSNDDNCVNNYKAAGFIPFYPGYEPATATTQAPSQAAH